ncbi:MAG: ABC transporter ATP-binding protein [bacterium]|nr:ABC transporter ATP-binding protein [bacterium]
MTDDAAIVRTEGLTKRFGDFTAVDALDLHVERGAIFAFLGGNGSGKSTTIRMLIGLLHPTAGTIRVDGVDVRRDPRAVRDRIGYMGQKVSLYQGLTLLENVEFYAGLFGLEGDGLTRRWDALRARFALAEAEDERPENLPAGIRQRAGLAVSMLHAPRLLFLDEPTAGVDVRSRALFWEVIHEEASRGVTVFVTTHFLEEVEYCDWVSFIDAGRLVADATPEALRERFSDGYRVTVTLPAPDRDAAAARLRDAGFTVTGDADGLVAHAPGLGDARLAVLAALQHATPGAVRIEQPSMLDVFRRVLESAAAAPSGSAA